MARGEQMIRIESDCVDCGFPCLGPACRYYAVEVHYCDACGEEIAPDDNDGVRLDNGTELCYYCARKMGMLDEDD